MTTSNTDLNVIPQGGRIERVLGNPRFQFVFGLVASLLGLLFTIVTMAAVLFSPTVQQASTFNISFSTLHSSMRAMGLGMMALLMLTAGLLGAYLSLRRSQRPLARLLGSACSAMSAGFGWWAFNVTFVVTLMYKNPVLMKRLELAGPTGDVILITWLLVAFFGTLLLVSVWMFSTLKFILFFPKPIKLAGIDPIATGQDIRAQLGERLRTRGARSFLATLFFGGFSEFNIRWLISPQFVALTIGLVLIALVDHQADELTGGIAADYTIYFWCWLPFAFISGKQKHLGEDDRRAIRWVVLGQTVWLIVFLSSLLLVLVLRGFGLLTFSGWGQSNLFTASLMMFMFAGFVLVFIATLAFSILYHGTMDPDLMIRRTWVVALVGIVSGMLFVLIERLSANLLTHWLDISQGAAFTVVGIVTAVCVFPIRAAAEKFIKRVVEKWQSTYLLADGIREDAVIVFADLSGYTALSEKNEREALILAAIFHRDAETVAEVHRGRLIKTIGDAVMMRFAKTEDAYAAIRKLIDEYSENAAPLVKAPLPVHAAVHRGEVVEGAKGDVFGATVNMAARLLDVAGPHEIVASESAIAGISPSIKTEAMGDRSFKNVENAVPCFRLAAA